MEKQSRIKLRPKRLSDAKEDFAWQTDPELVKLDAALLLEIPYQQYLSEYTFELCYPSQHRHEFAVENLEGQHIANCVYYNVNRNESKAEVGIMIGNREYWNNGYGVEIITALLEHIFKTTDLQNICLTTLDWNIRAQNCFHKSGFSDCGFLNRDSSTFIVMSLVRDEWLARQKKQENPLAMEASREKQPS
jgi:ribosomal-protein-alanine N-acetyltransferase